MSVKEMIWATDPTKGASLTLGQTDEVRRYIVCLETENAELKRKIKEHNKRCEDMCGHLMCHPSEERRCHDCPKDWRIDL